MKVFHLYRPEGASNITYTYIDRIYRNSRYCHSSAATSHHNPGVQIYSDCANIRDDVAYQRCIKYNMPHHAAKRGMATSDKINTTYIISRRLRTNWMNYIWQCAVAGFFTFLVFFVFSELIGIIVLASIGSTFFTVFALPGNRTAKPRNVIGSHVLCSLIGLACCPIHSLSLSAGVAVGAAAFLMVITDTEHPPAAGIALGLAMTQSSTLALSGAGFALAAALLAILLKKLLSPWLKDLF